MKYFLKKLLGHEIYYLGLWSPGLRNFFGKICNRPPSHPHPPTYLMYAPLGKPEVLIFPKVYLI